MSEKRFAFTLIELLIVVLIIAILAAIAVPNFLEFQTRAKVSRCMADMRTIKTALEAYYVDNDTYPAADPALTYSQRYRRMTTPIAYITTAPIDVFWNGPCPPGVTWPACDQQNDLGYFDYWTYLAASNISMTNPPNFPWQFPGKYKYQLRSLGPDLDYDGTTLMGGVMSGVVVPYDPTNGTVSNGDIITWGPSGPFGLPN